MSLPSAHVSVGGDSISEQSRPSSVVHVRLTATSQSPAGVGTTGAGSGVGSGAVGTTGDGGTAGGGDGLFFDAPLGAGVALGTGTGEVTGRHRLALVQPFPELEAVV